MECIAEHLYLLVQVSKTNKHIMSPLQKELDKYLVKELGADFKLKKYKKVEKLKWTLEINKTENTMKVVV